MGQEGQRQRLDNICHIASKEAFKGGPHHCEKNKRRGKSQQKQGRTRDNGNGVNAVRMKRNGRKVKRGSLQVCCKE